MKQIIAALIECQKEIENTKKSANNPFYNSKYSTLEMVLGATKEIANKNGIYLAQLPGADEHGQYVETRLLHTSEETLSSKTYLVLDKQNMQGVGSAITYARRYGLAAIFAIGQEDDDGNGAVTMDTPTKPSYVPPKSAGASMVAPVIQGNKPQAPLGGTPYEFPKAQVDRAVCAAFICTVGKYKGMTITHILNTVGAQTLRDYIDYIEDAAKKDGKPIGGAMADFIRNARGAMGPVNPPEDDLDMRSFVDFRT